MRWPVFFAVWMFATSSRADDTADLVTRGQELAKQGAWSQAITAFKQADAAEPRAQNACFIGLAYLRRELWAQAELYFARCHDRAKAADPLPDWAAEAEAQLATKLRDENVAAITIDVTPATAQPTIAISGFLPDEALGRGTIHLPPGHYTMKVSAQGYPDVTRELDLADKTPRVVRVQLAVPVVAVPPAPRPAPQRSYLPYYVIGGGLALGIAGIVVDEVALQPLRDDLRQSAPSFDAHSGSFDTWRDVTVGLWIGGVIATGVGTYLALRAHSTMAVSARVDRDGGAVLVGWQR
jgi:hypothetical protein